MEFKHVPLATVHSVLPQPYAALFMIIEPGVIFAALLSMVFDPDAHYASMAPDPCTSTALNHTTIQCITPRIRAMQYYLMGALAFSAVIEPAAIYVAAYKLRDQRDSRLVIQTILASFAAFDVFHAAAAIAGSEVNAILPLADGFNVYSAINFWIPLLWLVVRSAWFFRTGNKLKGL